ncbi:MAG: cell surface protein [Segetibacter sp.]|nr:cell surface protein [Segetibacter sp.]
MQNGSFFLTKTGFTVLQHNAYDLQKISEFNHGAASTSTADRGSSLAGTSRKLTLRSHAYEAAFVNAGNAQLVGEEQTATYNNYFIGNDPSKWAANCKIYKAVSYKNIYPNVDVRYYTASGKIKYDIVVKPGGNVNDIALMYTGVDGLEINNSELVVKTSAGNTKELAPFSYQLENGKQKEIGCKFKVSGNTVKFDVANYSKNQTLVIDPTLVFSTFTGSTADNWGHTATYAPDGSFFAGGIVFNNGFPTSTGAFDSTYNAGANDEEGIGGFDMGIIKFSPDGTNRIYATYIGGSNGNELPSSIIADVQGNLIIAGRTSSTDYPITTTQQTGPGGDYDIVLTKLNSAGSAILGSLKIGGKGRDGVNIRLKYPESSSTISIRRNYGDDARSEVIVDNAGNILLVSHTQSLDFPTTPGAFQKLLGGSQDGVFIKATNDLSAILVSSFLGGDNIDGAFALAVNPLNNNIYVAGNTVSEYLAGDTTAVLHGKFQGGVTDGFISIISSDGSTLRKTSYLGTEGDDMLYGIQFDDLGFPYITGTTTGTWPVINARFFQTGGKQFIAKLLPNLSNFVYSTVFGTNTPNPNLSPIAFQVDRCENVYVSGWGGEVNTRGAYPTAGTSGLTVTPDALKSVTDNSDFYFFVLEKNAGSQLYGSFFGQDGGSGDHVDGGTSRFTKDGMLYQAVCGNCSRDVLFPTTPGVWSKYNGSTGCNMVALKIDFRLCNITVPVHLAGFTVRELNNFHELTWQVNNEESGDIYVLEKRTSAGEEFSTAFTTVAKLRRSSNSYMTKVAATTAAETFYRLKIVSASGQYKYSPIVRLSKNGRNIFKAFVSANNLYLNIPSDAEAISLYNTDGKLLNKQTATGGGFTIIPLNKFPRGTMVVKVELKNEVLVRKVVN